MTVINGIIINTLTLITLICVNSAVEFVIKKRQEELKYQVLKTKVSFTSASSESEQEEEEGDLQLEQIENV